MMNKTSFTTDTEYKLKALAMDLEKHSQLEYDFENIIVPYEEAEIIEKIKSWMQQTAQQYDVSMYIKRVLYKTSESLQNRGPFEDIDEKYYRDCVKEYFSLPENSSYSEGKNLSVFFSQWLCSENCFRPGREGIINLALASHMPLSDLNHILQVKLGAAGIRARKPEEAILFYVLPHRMGHNGYHKLLQKYNQKLQFLKDNHPEKILATLKCFRGTQTVKDQLFSTVNEDEDRFIENLLSQPLDTYFKILKGLLEKDEEIDMKWQNALNIIEPKSLQELKDKTGRNRNSFIEHIFPGYAAMGKTARDRYLELERAIKEKRKHLETKVSKMNNMKGLESVALGSGNIFHGEKKGGDFLPIWCKREIKTPITARHIVELRKGNTPTLSGDLVLLNLQLVDLQMKEDALEENKLIVDLSQEERNNYQAGFKDSTNKLLHDCDMGLLNPVNPFHFLALISFSCESPFDSFLNIIEYLTGDDAELTIQFTKEEKDLLKEYSCCTRKELIKKLQEILPKAEDKRSFKLIDSVYDKLHLIDDEEFASLNVES